MKTNYFENRNFGLTITAIAIVLLLIGGFFAIKNRSLKKQVRDFKIKTEALVSENLSKVKETEKLVADINSLKNQNNSLKASLDETNMKIAAKESEISKLRKQSSNTSELNKKLKELELLKSESEKQIGLLNQNLDQLNQKNKELSVLLADAQNKNAVLTQNNQILMAMESNNFKSEALRGKKEKLTARAACTKKIVVNLDVPSASVNNIQFKVKTPAGKELSSLNDKTLTVNIPKNSAGSSNPISLAGEEINMSKIELTFSPEKKLDKGTYSFDVYNNEQFAVSTQIRLK